MSVSYFNISEGSQIAYQKLEGKGPGIVFLAGHGSDMFGSKAQALYDYCEATGRAFLRFDYFGHGMSSGDMMEGTISRWTKDATAIITQFTAGPQILIGSSLGGWIMLNLIKQKTVSAAGCIGIAAAPDFTEDLIWNSLSDDQQKQMEQTGKIGLPNPYADEDVIYPYQLITDGRENLILNAPLEISCPLILHQGMADHEVPWQTATAIAECVKSDDVAIHLRKGSGHRFSDETEIAALLASVEDLLARLAS